MASSMELLQLDQTQSALAQFTLPLIKVSKLLTIDSSGSQNMQQNCKSHGLEYKMKLILLMLTASSTNWFTILPNCSLPSLPLPKEDLL